MKHEIIYLNTVHYILISRLIIFMFKKFVNSNGCKFFETNIKLSFPLYTSYIKVINFTKLL